MFGVPLYVTVAVAVPKVPTASVSRYDARILSTVVASDMVVPPLANVPQFNPLII
jgi:hypothetical protein